MPKFHLVATFAITLFILATAGLGECHAQTAFPWTTFKGTDGKTYSYPRWGLIVADNKAYLSRADGELTLPTPTIVTEATIKVYFMGANGMWSNTPTIKLTATPAGTLNKITGPTPVGTDGKAQKWAFTWGDNIVSGNAVPPNVMAKVVVTVKSTSGGIELSTDYGPDSTVTTER